MNTSRMEVHQQNDSEEEFVCPVCLLLLLDPTTLNCGHTVCRGCLAGWYLSSQPRRQECPTCRQKWLGSPQINTMLRNVVERLHGERSAERRREMEANEAFNYKGNLEKFEMEMKQQRTSRLQHRERMFFCSGMTVAITAVLVVYLFMNGSSSSSEIKTRADMPVATWKSLDVADWLVSLGWARHYSEFAEQYDVDGRVLLRMEALKLMELLNITEGGHRSAFELAVSSLRESGLRMPQTMWEYRALYPGRCLYLSQGLKDIPRLTAVYLWLFHYEDIFLPFLHTTVPRHWDEELQFASTLPSPSLKQNVMFLAMMLVFPYGMMGLFAWSLRAAHTLTHLVVMYNCLLHTVLELNFVSSCIVNGRWRQWRQALGYQVSRVVMLGVFFCAWPILPSFICSGLLYYNLYYTPMMLTREIYNICFRPRQ
ncbi:bifunctional apoptosis regulator-like isoform X2 [Babylonia areolata]|uniref:bifunctional apoptosis regulator-like isoform X2 n=1 Tax=Babylonia areolata TaxID=304850 RepID=UPI003FD3A444